MCVSSMNVTHQGTSVNVLGKSGKASITHNGETVHFQVDYISEVDASGDEVGKSGSVKHSINTMAAQTFTFSPLVDKVYKNVSTKQLTFTSSISTIGKINVIVMIMNQTTSIGTETESWDVSTGDIKFNIELSGWTFCGCNDGNAAFIDVGIEIKGKKQETIQNTTIDLGGAIMQLSKRVVVDGTEQSMPEGYPKIQQKGSKQLFMFRFPTFSNNIIYDPVLQFGNDEPTPNNGIQHTISLSILVIVCIMQMLNGN